MIVRWFISKKVREATAMRKHVHRILCAQRDILGMDSVREVEKALATLDEGLKSGVDKSKLDSKMTELESAANKWLKPYPNANWRENVEVLLVALAVAMGIRTFFVQPFKIPTGSMQPTLFGVTSVPNLTYRRMMSEAQVAEQLRQQNSLQPATGLARLKEFFAGISFIDVKAKVDGALDRVGAPVGIRIVDFWQTLSIGGVAHTILLPPDCGQEKLTERAGVQLGQFFHKGETVLRLKVQAGDHLFVDRLTYNFRKPKRGEIAVFQTGGIQDPRMPQDQFYIKRLVALGGEKVQIGDDRHLVIDGRRLDASVEHFENVYSFDPRSPPAESQYSGHVNETVGAKFGRSNLAPLFPNEQAVHQVLPDHYMVMGDNTMNSFDSRGWGEFPAGNVIGKSFFVYWPITSRFGWGHR